MIIQLFRQVACKNAYVRVFRDIHTTAVNTTFWEREKKSGYAKNYPIISSKQVLDGLKELKSEIKLWTEEMKEKFDDDQILVFRPGEVDIAWKFSGIFI